MLEWCAIEIGGSVAGEPHQRSLLLTFASVLAVLAVVTLLGYVLFGSLGGG
jgi:hypothetical protein